MAKRDPNGPTAKLEEVHRLLCVGTGKLATMMAVRKMDVPTILEIEADVQRAAASMKDFSHLMVELNRRRDAEQAETKSESDESAGGSASGAFSLQITVNVASPPNDPIGGLVIGQSTPLSSEDTRSYYSWNSYIPLVAGELYNLTWRMLNGGGVYLPPNLINNLPYSDLKLQLIKIG
jgi:hypothetical protein